MIVTGWHPYPDDCNGPPDIEEYEGPPIVPAAVLTDENGETLDEAYWLAECPTCSRVYEHRSAAVVRIRAEECWERHDARREDAW